MSDSGTPWTAACQAPLSFTVSQSLLRLMSIVSTMLSKHLIFCCPLLLLPSFFLHSLMQSRLFASGGEVSELHLRHNPILNLSACLLPGRRTRDRRVEAAPGSEPRIQAKPSLLFITVSSNNQSIRWSCRQISKR